MPPNLTQHLTGAGHWTARCLETARGRADEALKIAQQVGVQAAIHSAEVVLGRIDVAEGRDDAARERLLRILSSATEDQHRAESHYWLWKLELDPAIEHRAEAERHYTALYPRFPKYEFKLRLDELRAAAVAMQTIESFDVLA